MKTSYLVSLALLAIVAGVLLALPKWRIETTPPVADPAAEMVAQAMRAPAPADIPPMPQTCFHWSPPTTGSPVVYYEIESQDAWGRPASCIQATSQDTTICYPETYIWHKIRVRGVDAQERRGPWSEWSANEQMLSVVVRFTNQLRQVMAAESVGQ